MITKIETVGSYKGTFLFIPSKTKVEADATKTFLPGMKVKWEITDRGECIYDVTKAAKEQVESLVNQALLSYDEDIMEKQEKRIIELFCKALPRWKAFQEGKVREYIPWDKKQKMQAEALLKEIDPEVLDLAVETKKSQTEIPEEERHPLI